LHISYNNIAQWVSNCLVARKSGGNSPRRCLPWTAWALGRLGGWASAALPQQRPAASQSLTPAILELSSQKRGRSRRAMGLPTGWNSPQECPLILRRSVWFGVSLQAPLRARHASLDMKACRRKKIAGTLGRRVTRNSQPMPLTSWPATSCASLRQVPNGEYQFSTHKIATYAQR
jgi:hypothetical protein